MDKILSKTSDELKHTQIELTNLALKLAGIAKVDLDFSIDSIKQVEIILSQINQQYIKTKNEEGISGMALELAAYIITVIEKNIGQGVWNRDSDEMGPETFPYCLQNGKIIFPYQWCLKRIFDGEADNVWSKFKTFVLDQN
jgi:hypothetical protein